MSNPRFLSNNCLAADKVLYKGHAVAGVAADSMSIAEVAVTLIDVDYEVLPAVVDVLDAMKDDARCCTKTGELHQSRRPSRWTALRRRRKVQHQRRQPVCV